MKEFKLIVAGSRNFNDYLKLRSHISYVAEIILKDQNVSIVSGCARGADSLALEFVIENQVKCHKFPADWDKYGKQAGFIRNETMAVFSDGLLVFWDGESKGTKHMINSMITHKKPVWIHNYMNPNEPTLYEQKEYV